MNSGDLRTTGEGSDLQGESSENGNGAHDEGEKQGNSEIESGKDRMIVSNIIQ